MKNNLLKYLKVVTLKYGNNIKKAREKDYDRY